MSEASRGADHRARASRLERLSPLDVSNLRFEDHGLPMHVAALAILEGTPLLDDSGQVRVDAVREHLERRLCLAPRLRQVLHRPRFGLGPPLWVDDPSFDIREHVQTRAIPAPGNEAALLKVCSELNESPLDRSRPLWEVWLLTGLADGTLGLLVRLHHVVADGIAALALMGALLDASPDAQAPVTSPWSARPIPSTRELFADNLARRVEAVSLLLHPSWMGRRLGRLIGQGRQVFRDGLAPRTSFNRPVGKRRRLVLVRANLDQAKAVAHAHGAKVNDVVLAAVAGGAQRLLERRGELKRGLILKTTVAASIRGSADDPATGNRVGIMLAPLPVVATEPVRRLEGIARAMAERKRHPPNQPSARFSQRLWVRAMFHQRLVNLFTSNLPGPLIPLYFAGARILELFQVGVVQGNIPIDVGVLSYAGQLNFDIVGDTDVVPDLDKFAEGLSGALDQLEVGLRSPISLGPDGDRRQQPGEMEERPLGPDRSGGRT